MPELLRARIAGKPVSWGRPEPGVPSVQAMAAWARMFLRNGIANPGWIWKNPPPRGKTRPHGKSDKWQKEAAKTFAALYKGKAPYEGPVVVTVRAVFQEPQTWPNHPAMRAWKGVEGLKPHRGSQDLDNIGKCVLDSLQRAGVLADDVWVVDLTLEKRCGPTSYIYCWVETFEPEGQEKLF